MHLIHSFYPTPYHARPRHNLSRGPPISTQLLGDCFRLERRKVCVEKGWMGLWCAKWELKDDVAYFYSYLKNKWATADSVAVIKGSDQTVVNFVENVFGKIFANN